MGPLPWHDINPIGCSQEILLYWTFSFFTASQTVCSNSESIFRTDPIILKVISTQKKRLKITSLVLNTTSIDSSSYQGSTNQPNYRYDPGTYDMSHIATGVRRTLILNSLKTKLNDWKYCKRQTKIKVSTNFWLAVVNIEWAMRNLTCKYKWSLLKMTNSVFWQDLENIVSIRLR